MILSAMKGAIKYFFIIIIVITDVGQVTIKVMVIYIHRLVYQT